MTIVPPIFNYHEFIAWLEEKVANHVPVPLKENEIDYAKYDALNLKRMQRLNKTIVITDGLKEQIEKLKSYQKWLVITEPWCGDSAQSLPALAKIAALNANIDFQIVLRDKNHPLIDKYLTNGGRAIPKMIVFDKDGKELFVWGPRPEPAQVISNDWKAKQDKTWDEYETELHTWYAKDKTQTIQNEFVEILKKMIL
jgi:hypothetical protein